LTIFDWLELKILLVPKPQTHGGLGVTYENGCQGAGLRRYGSAPVRISED